LIYTEFSGTTGPLFFISRVPGRIPLQLLFEERYA
jgi:hypothetical protein